MRRMFLRTVAVLVLSGAPVVGRAATQAEINAAIESGLAWLAAQQNPTTGAVGGGSYPLSSTAMAVLAFENEGSFPGGGGAYSTNVEKGLDYIFQWCRSRTISMQMHGNPDGNGNGRGIYFEQASAMYETGLAMQAIVASITPNRIVTTGQCAGLKYSDVIADAVDYLAWAQIDAAPGRGGWRYEPANNLATYADNSVAQWPVLGLVAAEQWGKAAPPFVKSELEYWVSYIQFKGGGADYGGSGYDTPTTYVNESKTGGLLVELYYLGRDQTSTAAKDALAFLDRHWSNPPASVWNGNKGHPYAMFSVFKGLELMKVASIPSAPANAETAAGDWWGDYAEYLVTTQAANGSWAGIDWPYGYWGPYLATPWYIVILQASVFPVSVDVTVPGAACDLTGYEVVVAYKVERFESSGTLTVYRDGELYGTVTLEQFIGASTHTIGVAPESAGAHTWKAVLEVTGSGITATAEDTASGTVYETPEVSGIPNQVAPFAPITLDDYQTCGIPGAVWAATGAPADWTVTIDPLTSVATVAAPAGAADPADITFTALFHWAGVDCTGSQTVTFTPNQPPVADPGKDYPFEEYEADEGGTLTLDGTGSYDPDGDALVSYDWDVDEDGIFEVPGATPTIPIAVDGPGEFYVHLRVCDEHGLCSVGTAEVSVANVAPAVGAITAPALVQVGQPVSASAGFTDPGKQDTHTAVWDWDGATSAGAVSEANGAGTVTGTHVYAVPGVYTVGLAVTDDDGGTGTSTFRYVVVFDPGAGFVTGGGWILSPPGAFRADPAAAGRANFGFVSQYKKGATVPTGNTEFQFQAGALNFHSSSYEWLVVTGASYARYKGVGTVNGAGAYRFMVWAGDGAPDTFRIKIWTEGADGVETVLYDNGMDQPIAGGSIVVHAK